MTRGSTRCACTDRSPTSRATSRCGPTSRVARRSTSSAGSPVRWTADRKQVMLERFDLDPTKKARAYSKGNRQKVALVAALASRAQLLLLDEPTSGLDPIMEAAFTESIREVKAEGRSVLLSSHIFAEVEKLADRVAIIREGVTVESGTMAELRHLTRTQVKAVFDGGADGLTGGARRPRPRDERRSRHLRGRRRRAAGGPGGGGAAEPALAGREPAVARGAVPAALRRRARRAGQRGREVTATAQAPVPHAAPAPAPASAHRPPADGLAGLGTMVRFVVRRNRVAAARVVRRHRRALRVRRRATTGACSPPSRRSTTSRSCPTRPGSRRLPAWPRLRPRSAGRCGPRSG